MLVGLDRHGVERALHERVLGEAADGVLSRRRELDPVGEVDPLQDCCDLVQAVVTARADDQSEVDLGARGRSSQCNSSVRATNSCGASASARVDGSRPIARNASSPRLRSMPASASELGSVLRRWANDASTVFFTCA